MAKADKRHGDKRQRKVPEIVGDLQIPGQLRPILRDEPAQREDLEERPAGEQHDHEHGEQKSRDGVSDDDHRAGRHVEAGAVAHRLADAERNRDGVGEQRHPQPERDRHRQFLADEVEHAGVAEIALAEIEAEIVPQQQAEALIGGLVEAELLLQHGDEFGVEPLRAAIFRRRRHIAGNAALAGLPGEISTAAAESRRGPRIRAGELGDQLLHRAAGRELHHDEGQEHDAEHGRHDQRDAAKNIGCHCVRADLLRRTNK